MAGIVPVPAGHLLRQVGVRKIDTAQLLRALADGGLVGASWNFAIWGLLHGLAIVVYRFRKHVPLIGLLFRGSDRMNLIFGLTITQIWVLMLWIPFRADTLADGGFFLSKMFGFGVSDGERGYPAWTLLLVMLPVFVDAAAGFRVERLRRMCPESPFVYGMAARAAFALILLLPPLVSTPLIYFRF